MPLFGRSKLDPALRDELGDYVDEYGALKSAHGERLDRYKDYRAELQVSRVSLAERKTDDYGNAPTMPNTPRRHSIALPFGQALTVKHAYRIAGRMPDVIVDRREESAAERYRSHTMEKIVWGTHHASNGDVQISAGAWDASQLGSCSYEVYFDQRKQMSLFREIDPATVLNVPGAVDPHDHERVYRFWQAPVASVKADYRGKDFRGVPIDVNEIQESHKFGETPMATLVEVATREKRLRFVLGDPIVPLFEQEHGFGFVPFVIIPNLGPERAIWGWSDYEFVRDIVSYLPVLFSREADIIRAISNGTYLDKKSGISPERIVSILRTGGVLPVGRDGSVEPVKTAEVPSFEPEHANRALEYLKMLGFSPDADWGNSGSTSGSDRALQLAPAYQIAGLKQVNWSSGLSRLYSMIFKMLERKQQSPAYYSGVARASSSLKQEKFGFKFGPGLDTQTFEPEDGTDPIELPTTAKELFGGDYCARFVWSNRVDPDDPAFVASELNKFAQGLQSMETTLERLGHQAPEDEMKRIENEAERFPWVNQGRVSLLKSQLQSQGQGDGGGAPYDPGAALGGALDTMGTPGGNALGADAMSGALPGGGTGTPYGAA